MIRQNLQLTKKLYSPIKWVEQIEYYVYDYNPFRIIMLVQLKWACDIRYFIFLQNKERFDEIVIIFVLFKYALIRYIEWKSCLAWVISTKK